MPSKGLLEKKRVSKVKMPPLNEIANADSVEEVKDYLSTFEAGRILNLSVGTIQKLVETNELHAWKTQGGHRRISATSVDSYKKHTFSRFGPKGHKVDRALRVLFIDNDEAHLRSIKKAIQNAQVELSCVYLSSGLEAMIQLPTQQPDVLFCELSLKDIDASDFLRRLDTTTAMARMGIVAWTRDESDEFDEQGRLPERAIFLKKPVPVAWIEGFLTAIAKPRK